MNRTGLLDSVNSRTANLFSMPDTASWMEGTHEEAFQINSNRCFIFIILAFIQPDRLFFSAGL